MMSANSLGNVQGGKNPVEYLYSIVKYSVEILSI